MHAMTTEVPVPKQHLAVWKLDVKALQKALTVHMAYSCIGWTINRLEPACNVLYDCIMLCPPAAKQMQDCGVHMH